MLWQNMGVQVPPGPGGGCVTKGPLAKYITPMPPASSPLISPHPPNPLSSLTIHLGPLMSTMDPKLGIKANPRTDGYGDNPRCHRRDVNNFFMGNSLRPDDLLSHITSNTNILNFQNQLQDVGFGGSKTSLHSAGHFSIWGYVCSQRKQDVGYDC